MADYFDLTPWRERYEKSPNLEWLIPNAIEKGSMFSIIGAPGTGKSFVATDLGVSVATGTPWLGNTSFTPTVKGNVILISPEATNSVLRRIAEQYISRGVNDEGNILVTDRPLPVRESEEDREKFIELELCEPTLILIDTWARATPGLNENSAQDVNRIIHELDIVRKRTGCSVGIIHHTTKAGTSARGTSALFGALDSEFVTLRSEEGISSEGTTVSYLKNSKQKNYQVWPQALAFEVSNSQALENVGHPRGLRWTPLLEDSRA